MANGSLRLNYLFIRGKNPRQCNWLRIPAAPVISETQDGDDWFMVHLTLVSLRGHQGFALR
jgi:hypothetical protein